METELEESSGNLIGLKCTVQYSYLGSVLIYLSRYDKGLVEFEAETATDDTPRKYNVCSCEILV